MSEQRARPAQRRRRGWWPGILGGLAVIAIVAGGIALTVTGVIDVRSEATADREACETADRAMREFGGSGLDARRQPYAARRTVEEARAGFLAAAELGKSEWVVEDLEFAAGYFGDVADALRSGNVGVFLRLSGESASVASRVRSTCQPVLAGS